MNGTILTGHVLDRLRELPGQSVHCVVTSPPYWGLRDYGIPPSIWGGNPDCQHVWPTGEVEREIRIQRFPRVECLKCGAWCGCFGLEPTPEMYVEHAVEIFREVRRVLRADGTCWVNIGDSYATRGRPAASNVPPAVGCISSDLKPKDLVGMPWRVAFALQSDGWFLRQDIIWSKPNPMPESVRDRCTKAHEYIFLLSKSQRYYWDFEAMQEPTSGTAHPRGNGVNPKATQWKTPDGWDTTSGNGGHGSFHKGGREDGRVGYAKKTGRNSWQLVDADPAHLAGTRPKQNASFSGAVNQLVDFRNKRSVWEVATEPYSDAHFATFPTELIKPCILAGSPANGVVLDPFSGSGTTGVVAMRHGRNYIGCELNRAYVEMSHRRILRDQSLLNRVQVLL